MHLFTMRWLSALALLLGGSLLQAQTVHVVSNNGLAFAPDQIQITVGDTVDWQIGGSHNVVQVSQATYDANGSTALPGGFELDFGGGKLAFDSVGTFYYVCNPHASQGMKGIVTVQEASTSLAQNLPQLEVSLRYLTSGLMELLVAAEVPGSAQVQVLDLSGRSWQQQEATLRAGENTLFLDLSSLPRGVYLIELRREGFAATTQRVLR